MFGFFSRGLAVGAVALWAQACGARTELDFGENGGASGSSSGGNSGASSTGGSLTASGGATLTPPPPSNVPVGCVKADPVIYLLTQSSELFTFDPIRFSTRSLGVLKCPGIVNTMAVSRDGTIWIGEASGSLARAHVGALSCEDTAFNPADVGFNRFGSGFMADLEGQEHYFLTQFIGAESVSLKEVNLLDFSSRVVGAFVPELPSTELAGTGDRRLLGLHAPDASVPARLLTIDPDTAAYKPLVELPIQGQDWAFDFAVWGGAAYTFIDENVQGSSKVFRYRLSDGALDDLGSLPMTVVGADSSTCAPL